jgi:hypothetical protein
MLHKILCEHYILRYGEDVWAMKEQINKFLTLAFHGTGDVLTLVTLPQEEIPRATERD